MEPTDFQKWPAQTDMLTAFPRQRPLDTLSSFLIGQASYDLIEEQIVGKRRCPHCRALGGRRHGMANALQRYRCDHCGRTLNALAGTQMARLLRPANGKASETRDLPHHSFPHLAQIEPLKMSLLIMTRIKK